MSVVNDLLAVVVGLGLGWFYFGGLWVTVQRVPSVERPVALAVLSSVCRLVLTGLGFWLVARGSMFRMVLALAGFVAARMVYLFRVGAELTAARPKPAADADADDEGGADDDPQS